MLAYTKAAALEAELLSHTPPTPPTPPKQEDLSFGETGQIPPTHLMRVVNLTRLRLQCAFSQFYYTVKSGRL